MTRSILGRITHTPHPWLFIYDVKYCEGGGEEPVVWKAASDVTSQGEGLSSPKGGHALYMAPGLGNMMTENRGWN